MELRPFGEIGIQISAVGIGCWGIAAAVDRLAQVCNKGNQRYIFNKSVTHPTKLRGDATDYSDPLNALAPAIGEVVAEFEAAKNEIKSLRNVDFGPFTSRALE